MDNGPSRLYNSLLTALLTIVVHIFYSLIRIFMVNHEDTHARCKKLK